MKKRIYSWILVAALLLSLAPAMTQSASAAENPSISGISLTLSSVLGLNLTVEPGAATDISAYSIRITTATSSQTVAGTEQNGKWVYTADLMAHRLHEDMKIELLQGETAIETRENYNISEYIDQITVDAYGKLMNDLVTALSSYGTYAANYAEKTSAADLATPDLTAYAPVISVSTDMRVGLGAYLYLDEACDLRFYLNKEYFQTNGYALYVDGTDVTELLEEKNGRLEYSISRILPQNWADTHTVECKSGEETVLKVDNYGVFSYAYTAFNRIQTEEGQTVGLKNLLKSMYTYSVAARTYCDNQNASDSAIEVLTALFEGSREVVEMSPIQCGAGFNMHFADYVVVDGEIRAYYIDTDDQGRSVTGLAISTDGVNFEDKGIVLGCSESYDSGYAAFAGVVYQDGVTYMVYECLGDEGSGQDVALATSTDGYTFTKQGVIIDNTDCPEWAASNVGTPDLVYVNGQWYVFFHGFNGIDCQIGVAYGSDLHDLTIHATPVLPTSDNADDPDSGTTGRRDIIYVDGWYYMVYEISTDMVNGNYEGAYWTHTFARSRDLINWEKRAPLVTQDSTGMGYDGPNWLIQDGHVYVYYRTGGNITHRVELRMKDSLTQTESSDKAAVKVRVNGNWYGSYLEEYKGLDDVWVPVYIDINKLNSNTENYFNISSNVINRGNYTDSSVDLYATKTTENLQSLVTNDQWCDGGWSGYADRNINIKLQVLDGTEWVTVVPNETASCDEHTVLGLFADNNTWYNSGRNMTIGDVSGYQYARVMLHLSVGTYLGVPTDYVEENFATFVQEPVITEEDNSAVRVRVNGSWYGAYLKDYKGQDDVWVPVNIDIGKLNANAVNYFNISSNVTNYGNLTDNSIDLYSTFTTTALESLVTNDQWCDNDWGGYSDRNINIQLQVYDGTQWVTVAPTEVTSNRDEHIVIGLFAGNSTWYNSGRNMNIGNVDFSQYQAARVLLHMHVGNNLEFPADYVQDNFATFISDPA